MTIQQNVDRLRNRIELSCQRAARSPKEILLVGVTKQRPFSDLAELYAAGISHFGENRPQDLLQKRELFTAQASWHLIGHLQKNKVSKVVGKTFLIHSVDSLELGVKIAQAAQSEGSICSILLQVNLLSEATKYGMNIDECRSVYEELLTYSSIRVSGLMTMAPCYDRTVRSEKLIRTTFQTTKQLFDSIKKDFKNPDFCDLSMGMSGDFEWAIEEGATIIRIGSFLFS